MRTSDRSDRPLRILVVPHTVFFPPYLDDLPALHREGSEPRAWIHDVVGDKTYLDQRLLTGPPRWLRALYRRLPMWVVQTLEVYRVGHRYDAVFLWSVADVTLVLALLLKLTGRRLPLVALMTRVSEPKKARLLRRVHTHIMKIVLPPVVQREFAIDRLGVPAEKLVDLPWTVDTGFWQAPPDADQPMICATGAEMRDYETLLRAVDGTGIPCHIAALLDTDRQDWRHADVDETASRQRLPDNVTVGRMSSLELRALYARSRFVVVPLRPTSSDNGITCMNEAWSMSRPVLCSAVEGQRDAFVPDVHGRLVPVGDAAALRAAIVELWNSPEAAVRMGLEGRRKVEREADHRVFSDGLNRLFAEIAGGRG